MKPKLLLVVLLFTLPLYQCAVRHRLEPSLKVSELRLSELPAHVQTPEVVYYRTLATECISFSRHEINNRDHNSAKVFQELAALYTKRAEHLAKMKEPQDRVRQFIAYEQAQSFFERIKELNAYYAEYPKGEKLYADEQR